MTLVVPFPAGSTTDNVARKLGEYMRTKTKTVVIVDSKAGADGNIAAQHVLRAPADGYTVFVTGNSVHGANANLYRELPFNPIDDFDMVGGVMDHVAYRGSPQVVVDLISGQFDFAFIDANTVGSHLKDRRLKGLAITSEKRLASMPEIPTLAEAMPGFQFGAWVGVVVRARTPPDIVARLSRIVEDFTSDPATVDYLTSIGSAPMPMSPTQLKSFVEAETKTWAEIVRAADIEKK